MLPLHARYQPSNASAKTDYMRVAARHSQVAYDATAFFANGTSVESLYADNATTTLKAGNFPTMLKIPHATQLWSRDVDPNNYLRPYSSREHIGSSQESELEYLLLKGERQSPANPSKFDYTGTESMALDATNQAFVPARKPTSSPVYLTPEQKRARHKYFVIYARSRHFHQSFPAQFLDMTETLGHFQDVNTNAGEIGGTVRSAMPVVEYLGLLDGGTETAYAGQRPGGRGVVH
jgi:hypothetical protein